MSIPSEIINLIERLQQELNQIEQEATEGLNLAKLRLDNYPDNSSLIQIFATFGNYLVFVEISRRRIDYTRVVVASEVLTKPQIQEAGEVLSEILGRALEAKVIVNRLKISLENW